MYQISDSHYRAAFEHASDAIFLHDPRDGHILEANRTSQALTGYSRAELLGMTVVGISPDDARFDVGQVVACVHRAAQEGAYTFEWIIRPRKGEDFPVEVTLRLIRVEGQQLVLALFRDVRERKRYEQRLISREARFRRLIEHSSDGIAILRQDGQVRYVSPSIATVLGYDERRATGRNALSYIHPADMARLRLALDHARADGPGGVRNAAYRILHRDGSWRHHEATVKDLTDAPDIGGILVNFRDVTARLEAERMARERERDLEHVARCRSMGELASALAHELNQPFAAISNYLGGCIHRLEGGCFDQAAMLEVLREAAQQAERAGKVMGSIVNFTRRNVPERQLADVNTIVRDVAPFIDLKAERADVEMEYALSSAPLEVVVDQILIEQVLLNIGFNGIEAMAETAHPLRRLRISTDRLPLAVRISIADRGHGLPRMNPDQIFNAFYTTKKTGLGIGLSLCRSIVDSHGGHMWATSGDRGTVFHVALPIAELEGAERMGGHA
ncbi:PAS domain S-box protein [Xanthobacter sp. TB0139]|uniref:PAS domain S-box protein n=1 Tax=Xanthobacter sp. TB0139 TaxID=3459178 RepID=UPI00403A4DAC